MKSHFFPFLFSRHPDDDDRIKYKIWQCFFFFILFISPVFAQIPRTISYQGVLTDTTGNPKPDGNYSFTFNLYESSSGGNIIWSETKNLSVAKGLFSTLLGDQTPFSDTLKFDKPYWLGIKEGNDAELSPRIALTSAGYSFSSIRSDTAKNIVDGKVVKSLNGLKDNIKIIGSGGTSINTNGDTIMISSSTSSNSGIKGIQNTNNTLDIKDPNGPTTTLNLKLPVSSAVISDTAKNIEKGKVVQSLNGLKDDVQLEGSGGTTINTSGNKITISSSSSGGGIQEVQNTNNTIDITNPKGSTATLNVNIPNVINGNAVKSLNGIKNDVTLKGSGGTTISTSGGAITISSSSGLQGLQNSDGTIDITNPGGPKPTINLKVPLSLNGEVGGANSILSGINTSNGDAIVGKSTGGRGIYGFSSGKPGVYGKSDGGTDSSAGVYGTGLYGVKGYSERGSGVVGTSSTAYGVTGSSSTGIGVLATSDAGNGIRCTSNSSVAIVASSGSGQGLFAESSDNYGIEGVTDGINMAGVYGKNEKNNGFGLLGYESSGLVNIGAAVYGSGASGCLAGWFNGDVTVTGALNVSGAKNFKIDDPIDPANKYLIHSCIESPDRMDIYNGNITTDESGTATVSLPAYFQALNIDYRYQLTTIGQQAQAWIDSKIQNNSFTIKTDKPNVEVSWQVTGIRNDPYAKANPMIVEKEKEANAKGKYIHPELYGQPKEDAIFYVKQPEMKQPDIKKP